MKFKIITVPDIFQHIAPTPLPIPRKGEMFQAIFPPYDPYQVTDVYHRVMPDNDDPNNADGIWEAVLNVAKL